MQDKLWIRFADETGLWAHDPATNLSYADRERIKAGQSTEVAEEKYSMIARSLRRLKIAAVGAIALLVVGSTLIELSILGILPSWVSEGLGAHFSVSLAMGAVLLIGLWQAMKLERQKLLCELVIAHDEERMADEDPSDDQEAVVA